MPDEQGRHLERAEVAAATLRAALALGLGLGLTAWSVASARADAEPRLLALAGLLASGLLAAWVWRRSAELALARRAGRQATGGADQGNQGQDLALEQARLQALDLGVNEAEFVLRRDGTIVTANDRAEAMYGWSRLELCRRNVRDLRSPAAQLQLPTQLAAVLAAGHGIFETEHRRRDGSAFAVEVSSRRLVVGGETYLHSLVRDVTERRLLQDGLHQALREQAVILDHAHVGIALVRGRHLVWCSRHVETLFGYTAAELSGQPTRLLYPTDLAHRAIGEEAYPALAAGRPHTSELELRRKDGRTFLARLTGTAIDPADPGQGSIWIFDDVTVARDLEEALLLKEERLRLAVAAASQVDWDWDLARDQLRFGEGWRGLTGNDPSTAATLQGWLGQVHPEDREAARRRLLACRDGLADGFEAEYRVCAEGGGWRWVRSRGRVSVRDGAGKLLRLSGVVTDIDEVHGLQEQLLASTRLASVGTLAAGVAHEVNNPLAWMSANLLLSAELLRGEPSPAAWSELRTLAAETLAGTERIAAIVKAMRSLGRPERPSAPLPVDVGAELTSALQLVRNRLEQRAKVELSIEPGLPPVLAPTSELGRVFLNLLVNAADALGEGGPQEQRIRASARLVGAEVVVEVSDTGCGLAPAVLERIFEPFFTTKEVGHGTGLGLSIARSIVSAAGGRIEAENGPSGGATFRVRLPSGGRSAEGPPAEAEAVPPPRRRVLVVDDEPMVGRAMRRWLGRSHDVTVLDSGAEALRRLDAGERWDAMLFDFMMPGLDGVDLHAALKARHPGLLPRLAFVTGGAFGARALDFLAAHEVMVLPKPVELAQLLSAVEQLAAAGQARPRV